MSKAYADLMVAFNQTRNPVQLTKDVRDLNICLANVLEREKAMLAELKDLRRAVLRLEGHE